MILGARSSEYHTLHDGHIVLVPGKVCTRYVLQFSARLQVPLLLKVLDSDNVIVALLRYKYNVESSIICVERNGYLSACDTEKDQMPLKKLNDRSM